MRIVIGCRIPSAGGGVRTYVESISTQLQRSGHDVTVYSPDAGQWRDWFGERGLRTAQHVDDFPDEIDWFLSQDQPTALDLLDARPGVPQAFVCHGILYDVDMAPQLDGVVKVIFTFYGPPATRVHATAVRPPIVQLRQPINLSRFSPQGPISRRPQRAVAISNYLVGERRQILIDGCKEAGIELELFGVNESKATSAPEHEINSADIVFGKARVTAEAMACGRAAYIYDAFGCDGWVTAENFERLVARGFAGSATSYTADVGRLAADLANYDSSMGQVNRDLAMATFSAVDHVARIVEELEKVVPSAPAHNDFAFELARLARTSWGFESELHVLRHRLNLANHRAEEANHRAEQLAAGNRDLSRKLETLTGSSRWKLLSGLMNPVDRLRGRT